MKKLAPRPLSPTDQITPIPLDNLRPPKLTLRTRTDHVPMAELVDSIRTLGLLSPILVKKLGSSYEIIAGSRRWAAVKHLKYKTVNCIIINAAALDAELMKLHENIVRQDVSPVQEAEFLRHLLKAHKLSVGKLAKAIGRSPDYIYQRLDLITTDPTIAEAVDAGTLTFTVARELLRMTNPDHRKRLLRTILDSGANVATVRGWVNDAGKLNWELPPSIPDSVTGASSKPPAEPLYTCEVCEKAKPVTKTIMIRMCKDCKYKILA